MYQLMLFEGMLPEYIHSATPSRFQVCSINGEQRQFSIDVQEGQDPESVALEALGYFVVTEIA